MRTTRPRRPRHPRRMAIIAGLLATAALVAVDATPAEAAQVTVTSDADSGPGTLRAAIDAGEVPEHRVRVYRDLLAAVEEAAAEHWE